MMLGLPRDAVRLAQPDPTWTEALTAIADEICMATGLPAERVQHIGSTAVTGLVAKPIIDIDIGLFDTEPVERTVACLVLAGFIDRGDFGGGVGRLLVQESAPDVRTVHVHIVRFGSKHWLRDLKFRDALRTDPDLRRRYGGRKTQLAQRFPNDRAAYRRGKDRFFFENGLGSP